MKVLIVAKTRRGGGACVGGITQEGKSVRLIAADAARNERAGLEYEVGEVWEIDFVPDPDILIPHIENIMVLRAHRVRVSDKVRETILRFMPPLTGGPGKLFDGFTQVTSAGALYVAESTGLPSHSTMFWIPDQPLKLDCEGKRIRYRYPTIDGGHALTFVGFQEPLAEIPAGTLLRISLAHRWRPADKPDEELRCFVQLSGWFIEQSPDGSEASATKAATDSSFAHMKSRPAAMLESPSSGEPILLARALDTLKRTFGFSEFLPLQRDIIERILKHEDTLVVMPTGAGKSLCYQLPALLFEGITLVVSPLIALMQDQVRQLRQAGVPAACLNHTVALPDYMSITSRARQGQLKILYLAPETLLRPETLLLLEQSNLACLAIDEAHCISEWGHDFRPEYRQLQAVRARFPKAVCLALTATATRRVRKDVRHQLGFPAAGEFVGSFNRKNLFLQAEPRKDSLAQILSFLARRRGQSGIIYSGTRKKADDLCTDLNANNWPALPYHAGLNPEVRHRNQERFIYDDVPLIVATIAFGMGINKPNIRFVIHAHLPKDLESYYQEIGRAGRDGLPADCLLLFSRADAVVHRKFINEGAESERPGRQARLNAMMRFAEARDCRRVPLLVYFEELFSGNCGNCDNCVQPSPAGETRDVTASALKFLTCVKATGQFFGAAHIISILRGSRSERVIARHHDRLPCHGQGNEHSAADWQELGRQLVSLGFLSQDLEFGSLKLTGKAREVLAGKQKVVVAVESARAEPGAPPVTQEPDRDLFNRLSALRRTIANEERVPPFLIFSDRTLMEMASVLPQSESELLAVNGVGETKLARHGNRFLEVIRQYGVPRTREPDQEITRSHQIAKIVRSATRYRFQQIGDLFAAGESLETIARRFQIKRETVIQHLTTYVHEGGSLDPRRVLACSGLTAPDLERVWKAFDRLGLERLAPVHQALAGSVEYGELNLFRLYLLCQKR